MSNPIVTGLTSYVEQNATGLIAKTKLGSKSAKLFNLITDVKGSTTLNLVSTDAVLQAGGCSFTASGSTELSQRILTPANLKVNQTFCDQNLRNTFVSHEVRLVAGQENLPFEEKFINDVIDSVDGQIEKMIYQGTTGDTNQFEGLISIMTTASTTANTTTLPTGSTAYDAILTAYQMLPEEVAEKDDTVILVSNGVYRKFIQELVAKNLFHHDAKEGAGEYMLPGTNVRVISTPGLNGTSTYDYIFAGRLSNIYYGVNSDGIFDDFDFFYSKDNQEFRLVIKFIAGVQVAYPNELVMVKVTK